MARRRMISAELMRSDEFLALPGESQLLYVHLLVEADDDGFLLGKNRIVTMLGLKEAAFHALTEAGFVLQFPSGAAVIAHWPVCNAIRKDRHTPTKYRAELAQLETVPEVGYVLKKEPPADQKGEVSIQKPCADVQKEASDVYKETPIVQTEEAPAASEPPVFTAEEPAAEKQNTDPPAQEFCPYAPPLPLPGGGEYRLLQRDVDVWRQKFNNVNVTEELRRLREYLEGRPDKRKPADEIGLYVEKWLGYAQNKTAGNGGKKKHIPDGSPPSYDIDLAEYLMNTRVPKLRKKEK